MTTNLTPELQKQIEQEGDQRSEGFETKLLASIAKTEYEIGAEIYAEKWQRAERKAERYEKALTLIEQMSDPGDYYKAICDMKAIASEALTPKQPTDDTVNG